MRISQGVIWITAPASEASTTQVAADGVIRCARSALSSKDAKTMKVVPAIAAGLVLIALLGATGCGTTSPPTTDADARAPSVVPFENADITITLDAVLVEGHPQTLVEDEGWGEFVITVSNPGAETLTVRDVKLLNTEGHYQKSAAGYGEITAPPNLGAGVAADVARTGSGLVLGTFIPFGGLLSSVLWGAASTTSAGGRATAQRSFNQRVLKTVELAPGGTMTGSAFLPNISNAAALVVDYTTDGRSERIELPLTELAQPAPTPEP